MHINIYDLRPNPEDPGTVPDVGPEPRPGVTTWTVPALGMVEIAQRRYLLTDEQHRAFERDALQHATLLPVTDVDVVRALDRIAREVVS